MSNSGHEDDWAPNGRPQSTLAQSFSAALDDAFKLDTDLEGLSQSVEQKKRNLSSRQTELEELEAKIRATEARLQQSTSRTTSPLSKSILPERSRNVSDSRNQNSSPIHARTSAPRGAASSDEDEEEQQQEERRVNGNGNRRAPPGPHVNRRPAGNGAQAHADTHTRAQARPQGMQRTNGGSFLQEEDDEDSSSSDEDEHEQQPASTHRQ